MNENSPITFSFPLAPIPKNFPEPLYAVMGTFAPIRRFIPPIRTEIVTVRSFTTVPIPKNTSRRKRVLNLTRDQLHKIKTLRERANWSYNQIAAINGCTHKQVQTACTQPLTPKKRRGRVAVNTPKRARIRDWLEENPGCRKIAWRLLPSLVPDLPYFSEATLNTAMKILDYSRRV
ncbi:hypothetical protein GGS21DRAFT_493202 [Xylaria nigripes]|nr:hypothetical protein GGS21DRAFT_493202 [Xylaria nigripes]